MLASYEDKKVTNKATQMFEWTLWQIYCRCKQTFWLRSDKALKKLIERGRAAKESADKLENEVKTINSKIAYLKKL